MLGNQNNNIVSQPHLASVADCGEGTVNTQGSQPHINACVMSSYGVVSLPPVGTDVVMLPLGGTAVCLGAVLQSAPGLQPGEIMLRSSGGASIVLKNDGRVLINGKEV